MTSPVTITELRFAPANDADRRTGLMGFLQFVVDDRWHVGNVTLRRTLAGRLVISWPGKRDGLGIHRDFIRPTNVSRAAIERAVIVAIGRKLAGARP